MKVVKFDGKEGIWEMYDGTIVTIDDVINQLIVKKGKLGDQEECARFKAFVKSPIDHEVYRNNTELFELIKELYDSELITLLAHYLIENNVYFEITYTPAINLTANLYLHKLNKPIIKDNDKYHRVKEMKELIENISFQDREYSFKMDSHIFTMKLNLKKREVEEYEMRKIIVDDDIPSHHICIEALDAEFSRSFDVALRNVADSFKLIFGLPKNIL